MNIKLKERKPKEIKTKMIMDQGRKMINKCTYEDCNNITTDTINNKIYDCTLSFQTENVKV